MFSTFSFKKTGFNADILPLLYHGISGKEQETDKLVFLIYNLVDHKE